MADLFASALKDQQDYYLNTNPYNIGGQLLGGIAKADYSGFGNPWVGPLAAALGGFASGFGTIYGAKQAKSMANADLSALTQALSNPAEMQKLAADPERGNLASAFIFDRAQKSQDIQAELQKVLGGKGMILTDQGVRPLPGYAETDANMAAMTTGANELVKKKLDWPTVAPERETELRKEFQTTPEYTNFSTVKQMYESMLKSAADQSGQSDLDFVIGTAKVLDPSSVVRGSEGEAVINTGGLPGVFNNIYGWVQGKNRLTPEMRQALLDLSGRRYDSARNIFEYKRNEYKDLAAKQNLNPANVVLYPPTFTASELQDPSITPLMKGLIRAESAGNPAAISPKGAYGLTQLMPGTAQDIAGQLGEDYRREDIKQNIRFGKYYLDKLSGMFNGDTNLALAAYNWGPQNVIDTINRLGTTDYAKIKGALPPETQKYVDNVLGSVSGADAAKQITLAPQTPKGSGISAPPSPMRGESLQQYIARVRGK